MQQQPVILSGLVLGLSNAILALILAMGWWALTDGQLAAINGVIVALVALFTWFLQQRTVPVASLQSDDGKPVTAASVRGGQIINWNK